MLRLQNKPSARKPAMQRLHGLSPHFRLVLKGFSPTRRFRPADRRFLHVQRLEACRRTETDRIAAAPGHGATGAQQGRNGSATGGANWFLAFVPLSC